jgi:hypothetical protein
MAAEHALERTLDLPRPKNPFVRLAQSIRRRPLVWFFVLTFAYSWWPSLLYATTGAGPTILSCGPTLGAITVLSVTSGKAGVKALFRSMLGWRVATRQSWMLVVVWGIAAALVVRYGRGFRKAPERA